MDGRNQLSAQLNDLEIKSKKLETEAEHWTHLSLICPIVKPQHFNLVKQLLFYQTYG